jgi:N-methylhydantoinase A
MWKVGIDTGGTFTDIVATDGREMRTAKVASTPPQFEHGVLASIAAVRLDPAEIELIAHGTTVSTNATITKTGAKTALITTRGFRDVLELRRHNRGEIYDVLWDPPPPLVPRQLRFEVTERLSYTGEIITPLSEAEVRACVATLRRREIEALAICFLHAYENPAHERRAREIVLEQLPELFVSISSDLVREPQEFERTSTTVANSYVGPVLAGYVSRLLDWLRHHGFDGELMIMHSGGGLMPAEAIIAVPARTLTSGPSAGAMAVEAYANPDGPRAARDTFAVSGAPAAGAMASGTLAATTGLADVISIDIGGTSADIAVVRNGEVHLVGEYEPEFGLPIRFPAVDLLTIGAGGGSIAWVDRAGAARVGPQSAGAVPGPACYGREGEDATVTDACVVLGRLPAESTLAGGLRLDEALARRAVGRFSDLIGATTEEGALGILEIANSNMARAIRVMTVERGLDPRRFVLVPFGGAGPMLACDLADSIGVSRVVVPPAPGVLSALGTLQVDIVHDYARSYIADLDAVDPALVDQHFAEMDERGRAALRHDRVPPDRQLLLHSIDLRYVGQVKTLSLRLGGETTTEQRLAGALLAFFEEYERRFHYVTTDIPVESVALRVRARGLAERVGAVRSTSADTSRGRGESEAVFSGGRFRVQRLAREGLGPGSEVIGPAIIEQVDTTTVVHPGWRATTDDIGNLHLLRRESEGAS